MEFALAAFEQCDDRCVWRMRRPIQLPSVEPQRKIRSEEGDGSVPVREKMVHDDGWDELTVLRISRIAMNELKHPLCETAL